VQIGDILGYFRDPSVAHALLYPSPTPHTFFETKRQDAALTQFE
jgi:hypothetical protein